MNCREFEQAWQAILDDRGHGARDQSLDAHAASCAACRQLSEKFRALQLALRSWTPPTPPPGLADSVLARLETPEPAVIPFPAGAWRLAASIAATVLAAGVGLWAVLRPDGELPRVPRPGPVAQAPRPLSDSLAEATTATLDLARTTSAPAARLGRLMLGTASLPAREPAPNTDLADGPDAAGSVMRVVGDRVASGVRPISGTARRAFSFIIPKGPAGPDPSPNAGRRRGA